MEVHAEGFYSWIVTNKKEKKTVIFYPNFIHFRNKFSHQRNDSSILGTKRLHFYLHQFVRRHMFTWENKNSERPQFEIFFEVKKKRKLFGLLMVHMFNCGVHKAREKNTYLFFFNLEWIILQKNGQPFWRCWRTFLHFILVKFLQSIFLNNLNKIIKIHKKQQNT